MTDLTDKQIEKMLAGAAKATPGPWTNTKIGIARTVRVPGGKPIAEIWHSGNEQEIDGNARHIANCDPQTIIALCEELKRLRAKENGK